MIIEDVINKINSQLFATKLFGFSWGLCEKVMDGAGNERPAHYCGNGIYENVFDAEKYTGVSYIRRNGKVIFGELSEEKQQIDCNVMTEVRVPLKIVCIVPKREIVDNAFADDIVAGKVAAILNSVKEFIADADSSILVVEDYETDNQIILSEEFSGLTQKDIHYKYAFVSINLFARIVIDSACLEVACEGAPACYLSTPLFVKCSDLSFIDQTNGGGTYGILTGAVDNVNVTFTVSQGKYVSGKLTVYLNGQLLTQGVDWGESSPNAGTFVIIPQAERPAPFTGDILTAIYQ